MIFNAGTESIFFNNQTFLSFNLLDWKFIVPGTPSIIANWNVKNRFTFFFSMNIDVINDQFVHKI